MEAMRIHALGRGDGGFPIISEPSTAIDPRQRALDNFDCRTIHFRRSGFELLAGVAAVVENVRNSRKAFAAAADEAWRAVPVLNARLLHDPGQHMAFRVRHDVALAAL